MYMRKDKSTKNEDALCLLNRRSPAGGSTHQLIATWKRRVFHPQPQPQPRRRPILFAIDQSPGFPVLCICNPPPVFVTPALLYLSPPLTPCCICNPCSIVFEAFLCPRPIVSHDGPDCQTSNLAGPRLVTDNPLVYVTIDYMLRALKIKLVD